MSSYWANFAATGNPNGKGLPKWPGYDAKSDLSMEFGDEVVVRREVNKTALDFFDRAAATTSGAPPTSPRPAAAPRPSEPRP